MSGFEKLVISHVFTPETRDEGRAMQVTTIACKNLKHLSLGFAMSTGVVSTIARQCPRLTKCYFWDDEIIDDEDLCQRSLSCPNLQQIRLQCTKYIMHLEYLTTVQHLEDLPLFFLTDKFIDKPLLLKFVESCPKLKQITVSDWKT